MEHHPSANERKYILLFVQFGNGHLGQSTFKCIRRCLFDNTLFTLTKREMYLVQKAEPVGMVRPQLLASMPDDTLYLW